MRIATAKSSPARPRLLAKPRHKVLEIVNDLNREIVALLRNAHFHLPALEEMNWMTAARADFDDFKAQPGLTEIRAQRVS